MKQSTKLFIFSLFTLHCFVTAALADSLNPCQEEITKFCSGTSSGGSRIFNCLKEHEQDLSEACKSHQAFLRRKVTGAFLECLDDVDYFCKEVRPIGRRVFRCLKQHEAEVSAECRAKLTK